MSDHTNLKVDLTKYETPEKTTTSLKKLIKEVSLNLAGSTRKQNELRKNVALFMVDNASVLSFNDYKKIHAVYNYLTKRCKKITE